MFWNNCTLGVVHFSPCHPYQDIFFPTLLREGQARLNMSDHFNKETTTKSLFYLKYYKKFYLKYNLTWVINADIVLG